MTEALFLKANEFGRVAEVLKQLLEAAR